ncbi:hypothetical protein BCUE_0080 [Candidatus Kinetoplastibacterium blastocrithidii TCC012E]|uniref:Uncharacterized protein n=1 Tax=Candidatus Kinetoplastidibacterium blastocrithidiae TCC012E TaxID=1208922 RepID=M1MEB7_9PROT|nr:hypothetical protein BCUE_0080 [Candidatus Kinetoplastibacterium blastocrithidii TCC012E]
MLFKVVELYYTDGLFINNIKFYLFNIDEFRSSINRFVIL